MSARQGEEIVKLEVSSELSQPKPPASGSPNGLKAQ